MKAMPSTLELLISRKEHLESQLKAALKYQLAANSTGLSKKLKMEIKKIDKQIKKLNGNSSNWLSSLLIKLSFKKGSSDEAS